MNKESYIDIISRDNVEELRKLVNSNNSTNLFERIYQLDFDYNNLKEDYLTIFHVAACHNSLRCFEYLHIKCNFPIDIESSSSCTPFQFAVFIGSVDVVEYIFRYYEANFGQDGLENKLFSEEYSNPKNVNSIILFAISKNPNILNLLFKYGYSFGKYSDTCKYKINKALKYSITLKNTQFFEILLKKYCESNLEKDSILILYATALQNNSALRLLLDAKFNPSYMAEDFRTPISIACFYSNVETVKMLAEVTEEVDIPANIKAPSAVHWICSSKSPEIAKILCSKGIDVNRVDAQGRMGPSFFISSNNNNKNNIEILTVLLNHGLKINFHLPGKNTILGDCLKSDIFKDSIEFTEFLLDNGADPNALIDSGGKSPVTCIEHIKRNARPSTKYKELYDNYFNS